MKIVLIIKTLVLVSVLFFTINSFAQNGIDENEIEITYKILEHDPSTNNFVNKENSEYAKWSECENKFMNLPAGTYNTSITILKDINTNIPLNVDVRFVELNIDSYKIEYNGEGSFISVGNGTEGGGGNINIKAESGGKIITEGNVIEAKSSSYINIENADICSNSGYVIYKSESDYDFAPKYSLKNCTLKGNPSPVNFWGNPDNDVSFGIGGFAYYNNETGSKYPVFLWVDENGDFHCEYINEWGEYKTATSFSVVANSGIPAIGTYKIPENCEVNLYQGDNKLNYAIKESEDKYHYKEEGKMPNIVGEDDKVIVQLVANPGFVLYDNTVIYGEKFTTGEIEINIENVNNNYVDISDEFNSDGQIKVMKRDTINVSNLSELIKANKEVTIDNKVTSKSIAVINLLNDIDMEGEVNDDDPNNITITTINNLHLGTLESPFEGILNGNGFKLYNFVSQNEDGGSMFGYIGKSGVIKDLNIEGMHVISADAQIAPNDTISLLADELNGEICCVSFAGKIYSYNELNESVKIAWVKLLGDDASISKSYVYVIDDEMIKENGNKVCVVLKQNMVVGKGKGRTYKVCQGPKPATKSVVVNPDPTSGEEYDEISKNQRECTAEQFANGEVAYWLNYDGQGYSGAYNKLWSQDEEYPVLASSRNPYVVKLLYVIEGASSADDINITTKFAKVGDEAELSYTRCPETITIDGEPVNSIGLDKTIFTIPETVDEEGIVTIRISLPTAIIDAIEQSKTFDINISVKGNNVVIDNVANQFVELYDMNGHCLVSQVVQSESMIFAVPFDGIYVLKVAGRKTKKIRIKN